MIATCPRHVTRLLRGRPQLVTQTRILSMKIPYDRPSSLAVTLALASSISGLWGCSSNQEFGIADSGSTVSCEVTEQFDVALAENGTTGILWEERIQDPTIFELATSDLDRSTGVAGAGGTRTFVFECVGTGESKLELFRVQAGAEPTGVPDFTLNVIVN